MNSRWFLSASIAPLTLLLTSCLTTPRPSGEANQVDFVSDIKPIFQDRCVMCHNRQTLPDRTSFESRKLALAGDKQGPVIIPGNPSASRLILALAAPEIHEQAMPPVSVRVSKAEAALISQWIREGAQWPSGPAGRIIPTERPLE